MWSSSQHEEPWAPEMQAVAEDEEGEAPHRRSLAEMSALSFRSGLHSEPCSRLTQVKTASNCSSVLNGTGILSCLAPASGVALCKDQCLLYQGSEDIMCRQRWRLEHFWTRWHVTWTSASSEPSGQQATPLLRHLT